MSLAIVFEQAAATAGELVTSLESYGDLLFLVGDDPYARRCVPLLESAGTVVALTGDPAGDAAGLRAAGVTGLVAFGDWGVEVGAALAAELDLPFHDRPTARALTDKDVQRRLLDEAGVAGARHRLVETPADWDTAVRGLAFPLVVKPSRGKGSRNTSLVRHEAEGRDLVARLLDRDRTGHETRLVVEEYLAGGDTAPYGDYVSVESVCSAGSVRHVGVTGKLPLAYPFRETGQFHPAVLPSPLLRDVLELAEAALRALGCAYGVTHTEIKLTDRGPRVLEVNGRLGGNIAELYRRALGIDMIRVAADAALGVTPDLDVTVRDGIHFQYYNQPPLGVTRLTAVEGTRSLRPHPHIETYSQFVKPGSALPDDMRSLFLDRIAGSAGSPQEMWRALDDCLPRLRFTFEGPQGETVADGALLRKLNAQGPSVD
ncbi:MULTISPECIES: ATP-grasp domain-containing protein [Streptomyces]|uniref:Alanine-anticapsin ligase BacD n=1 Tax=Streptomyces chartreusis NRRL 3882 TaxID=1079985 RepID=A0A2N9B237_STRCX|nr:MULTISPECIES: ATP-grasp domain-containing protein [Streptomyces]MYS92365.1 ATP-grasp domain-containing protein [Streptomyces sp. SID5464]SOR77375.1 Alanine-anticapsin ligase BacD [Streptomyces chartreusis NRRL 3882]